MKFTVFFVGLLMAMVSSVQAQTAPSVVSLSSSSRPYQGQAITLSVSVNGTLPFTYQWSKNGVPIAGATSITYTIPTIVQTDTGSYTVTVTNAGGSVTSGVILLDVQAATIAKLSYQPSNVSYNVGDAINLYASVYNATAPVTVVWKKDGNIIATVSNSYSYSIANAQATDAGTYTFTVTNAAGSLTSNPFTVTVTPVTAPVFTNSPSNTTATVGGYFSFYAYLSSTNGVSYQWYKDGVAIAGANNYYYSKGNAALTDAGVYSVVATNSTGSTTSGGATLVVQPAPPVTAPSGVYLNSLVVFLSSGDYLNLYASVPSGTAPYTYQWRKDGVDIPGATSSGYTKSGFSAADVGAYSVVVSNSAGSVLSRDTTVGMYSPTAPTILGNPQSVAVSAGSYVSLGVNATGTMPLAYQWQKDGVAIPGANGSSYYLYAASASNAGSYTVVVSNPYGSVTSTPGKLALLPAAALAITSQPTSTSVSPIGTLSLYVSATGQSNLTYQWKKDGVAIAGATDSYLYIYNPASSDSGLYTVDVSDSTGTVTSAPATVTVNAVTSPVIVVQPSNASLLVGDQGSLYVGIAKSQLDSIQWYRNGVAIPGATSQSIYVYGQPSYAGTYHAVVTNGAGSVTSRDATITVDFFATRPAIISISASQLVVGGSPATLNVGVNPALTGTSIVWKKDGTVVPNATSGNLYLNNFGLADAGTYTAEVTVSGVTTVSAPIALDLLNKNVAPTIITQTGPLAVAAGTYSSLIVTADGEAPFTYQWTKDGVAIPNATSSSYYINNMAASYVGNYNVTVTNRVGSVSGTPAALTLSPSAVSSKPPVITAQPVSQTWNVSTSAYATVSVTAMYTPDGSTTYTWYKDGVVVGSNSYYLAYGTVTAALAGRYKVVITNSAGSTTSDEAVITVVSPPIKPAFTTQPAAQTAYIGGPASFSAAASGASTVSYQWRKDGVAMAGATNATLTLSNLQAGDAGEYSVIATNAEGSISSAGAILTLLPSVAPTISTQPVSQWLMVDAAASISVTATGTPAPSYQWTRNGVAIAGATGPTLAFNALAETDAGTYAVVVSNYGGSVTSNAVTLGVYDQAPWAPVITAQPGDQTRGPGETVNLAVSVAGYPVPALQWYKDGAALAGATSTTLSLGKMTAALAGHYWVVVTNDLGTVQSRTAVLTYVPSPFAGSYSGQLTSGEPWALTVNSDGTAVFLGRLDNFGQLVFSDNFSVLPTGDFIVTGNPPAVVSLPASLFYGTALAGHIAADGKVTGQMSGTTATLVGAEIVIAGKAHAYAGIYKSIHSDSPAAEIHAIVAPDGGLVMMETDAKGVRGGAGTVAADGSFTVVTATFACTGTLSSSTGEIALTDAVQPQITTAPVDQIAAVKGDVTLAAIATGTPAPTYQWLKDGVAIKGATGATLALSGVTKDQAGHYSVTVTNLAGSATSAAALLSVFDVLPAAPQFTTQPQSHAFAPGETVSLAVATSGYPAPALQWYKDETAIAGATTATLTLGKISAAYVGRYYAVATNQFGTAQSAAAAVSSTGSPYAGTFFGTFSDNAGRWALRVKDDATGTFIAYLTSRNSAIVVSLTVDPNGNFTVTSTEIKPLTAAAVHAASAGSTGLSSGTAAAAGFTLTGTINGGNLTGQAAGLGVTLSGTADGGAGSAAAGYYTAAATGTSGGSSYAIVAPSGQSLVVATTSTSVDGIAGVLDANGSLSGAASTGDQLVVSVSSASQSVSATLTPSGGTVPVVYAGLSDTVTPWKQLINLSGRASSGTGDNVAIGGFVIGGSGTKRVLLRALGPTLATQNIPVGEALADPTIEVHDVLHASTIIASNDNWSDGGNGAPIAALASQLGATALSGSDGKSAAAILDLAPGVYSFIAAGKNQTTGIVLVEVYDADGANSPAKLLNISMRANCALGDSVAIGGFVVSGNAPKTVLVRAVGPTLVTQGLKAGEVLADPAIEVHDVIHSNKIIATNDNWTDSAAAVAATGARLGATPLDSSDAKSSAMLITLQPGVYSFVVNGKNNTAGIVLIEVYDAD